MGIGELNTLLEIEIIQKSFVKCRILVYKYYFEVKNNIAK